MTRRDMRYRGILLAACLLWTTIGGIARGEAKRVLIFGIDGLDPKLLDGFIAEGILPNLKALAEEGGYRPLQTSMPPLSPVAWSNFITGMDSGGHGIFDFVHRDPAAFEPHLSMSRAMPAGRTLNVGSWVIPLSGGGVENLRKGKAFWQILEESGVPTTIYKMPANFPPVHSSGKALSGMGTPDILGTPGTFSYYTNLPPPNSDDISGGRVFEVQVVNNAVEAKLIGPPNSFRRFEKETKIQPGVISRGKEYEVPDLTADFKVYIDPREPVAKFQVGETEFVLKEGEWSPWVRVDFEAVPWLVSISAIGKFYFKQARPFKLYVSPLQINPEAPAMPISEPEDWCEDLAEHLGYFYTKELPEETKALTAGIFSGAEFWRQSQFVLEESKKAWDYLLSTYKEGLLFLYLSSVDQNCHMLYRWIDPKHPFYEDDPLLKEGARSLYKEVDAAVGRARAVVGDDATVMVMSDHGFAPFYWGVNLNSWLAEKGYVKLRDPANQEKFEFYADVDWSRTKAYALGLNGLYLNLKGREKNGSVDEADYDALLDSLEKDMLEMVDPRNGLKPISLVVRPRRDFHGPYADDGPDILVGYSWGYRSSWESPLGEFPKDIFVDNKEAWSGDHSMDYRLVPGVLMSNRKITLESPALTDLTVTVLDEYGIAKLPEMIGQDCLAEK